MNVRHLPAAVCFAPAVPTDEERAAATPALPPEAHAVPVSIKTEETEKVRKARSEPKWAQGRAVRRRLWTDAVAALNAQGGHVERYVRSFALPPVPTAEDVRNWGLSESALLARQQSAQRARRVLGKTIAVYLNADVRSRSGFGVWNTIFMVPTGNGYALVCGRTAAEEVAFQGSYAERWTEAAARSTASTDARAQLLAVALRMVDDNRRGIRQ